jgi:DNA-binding response OmpR family regulator
VRILFVDNHPEFTATVIDQFLREHEVIVVPTIAGAKAQFETSAFDVVLVDYDLDDGKGDELVRWLRQSCVRAKLIAVSARESGNTALRSAGIDDVCSKLEFSRIRSVLGNAKP